MGTSVAALLHYGGINQGVLDAITILESPTRPSELLKILDYPRNTNKKPYWEHFTADENTVVIESRPTLPDLDAILQLPEQLWLTFGRDTIEIHFIMIEMKIFMQPRNLQPVMMDAIKYFCVLFDSPECNITSDESIEYYAFHEGDLFGATPSRVDEEEKGKIIPLADIYVPYPDPHIIMQPQSEQESDVKTGQYVLWKRDEPQPDGCINPLYWKKKKSGYLHIIFDEKTASS